MNGFVEDRSVLSRRASPPDVVVHYGALPEQIADVRYGKKNAAHRPLAIVIHGGFWRPAIDRTHTGPMCEAIANEGWTVASIEYRRIAGQPDVTTGDVVDGVAKIPELTENHSGKAIVIGHSAGGHLCLYVAAKNSASSLIGAIALAPAADLRMAEGLQLGDGAAAAFLGAPAAQRADLDPVRLASPTIATTLIHGMQDAVVPISLAEAYVAKHPVARLVRVENCGHFGVVDPLSSAWSTVIEELKRLS